jgi:hypothetical protein
MRILERLRLRRQELLARIGLIEEMRRGSVTRQFLKVRLKNQAEPVLSGPYALFTRKSGGRTVGRRLQDSEEIRRLEQQVENYHAFQGLCRQLVEVSEQICEHKDKEHSR